jgi:hypothetical protein
MAFLCLAFITVIHVAYVLNTPILLLNLKLKHELMFVNFLRHVAAKADIVNSADHHQYAPTDNYIRAL